MDLRLKPTKLAYGVHDTHATRVQKLCTSVYNEDSHWVVKQAAHVWLASDRFAFLDEVKSGDHPESGEDGSFDSSDGKEQLSEPNAKQRLKYELLAWLKESDMGSQLRNHIHSTHKRFQREFNRFVSATSLSHESTDEGPTGFLKTIFPTGMHVELPRVGFGVEEPLLVIDTARKQWDARLRFELRSVASRQKRPLRSIRNEFLGKLGSNAAQRAAMMEDEHAARFVYTSEDLLDTMVAIVNPNNSAVGSGFNNKPGQSQFPLDLVHVMLSTPSMQELRVTFRELRPEFCQIGVDEDHNAEFLAEKLQTGNELTRSVAQVPLIQQYAKTGVPASLRPALWQTLVGSSRDTGRYEKLFQSVTEWDYITDELIRYDVQHAIDSDEFFVFAEMLEEIMLVFSRDDSVAKDCTLTPNSAILLSAPLPSSTNPDHRSRNVDTYAVPPCTVVPFYQQTMLAAPLCFLYREPSAVYALFKNLFCQYFCRLHIISSRQGSILYLAKLFERLVQVQHPRVVFHCCRYGVAPLRVAFPWMFTAFAGFLPVQEVLKLWDRVLAYESLDLVAILAAAIFCYRAPSVLKCTSAEDIETVFRELHTLHAIPLLQDFLFSTENLD